METLAQDKKLLIEKCIKSNRRFQNNEALYDEIFDETYKNSVALLASVTSESTAELYLKRIVTNSIANVLKNNSVKKEIKTESFNVDKESFESNSPEDKFNPEYSGHRVIFRNVELEEGGEDLFVKREILKSITKSLNKIESEEPQEDFITIFKLRYEDGLTQSEIAEKLGISQTVVANKMFELMNKVRENMN